MSTDGTSWRRRRLATRRRGRCRDAPSRIRPTGSRRWSTWSPSLAKAVPRGAVGWHRAVGDAPDARAGRRRRGAASDRRSRGRTTAPIRTASGSAPRPATTALYRDDRSMGRRPLPAPDVPLARARGAPSRVERAAPHPRREGPSLLPVDRRGGHRPEHGDGVRLLLAGDGELGANAGRRRGAEVAAAWKRRRSRAGCAPTSRRPRVCRRGCPSSWARRIRSAARSAPARRRRAIACRSGERAPRSSA